MDLFPTIRFTSEQETRPLFFRSPALFSNQVAMFFSDAEEERVRKELKAIEQSAGRRPEDKKDRKSTRLNSSHMPKSRMPSSA